MRTVNISDSTYKNTFNVVNNSKLPAMRKKKSIQYSM